VTNMDDIDHMLARLAHAPSPPALDDLGARVLHRLLAQPASRSSFGVGAFTIVAALAMGVVGAELPVASPAATVPLSPFGASSPLAPSTLLAGEP
jgi:hypothetical protein